MPKGECRFVFQVVKAGFKPAAGYNPALHPLLQWRWPKGGATTDRR